MSNKERLIKELSKVVCICKGIPLKNILMAVSQETSLAHVNKTCGSGSGGCKGERCRPRILSIIKEYEEMKNDE
jgi:bacterioferritin-associated ferredoxin